MSECTNETREYTILNDGYKPTDAEVKELAQQLQNYKKAYNILMDYWDSLPDEEKEEIDKQLNEVEL